MARTKRLIASTVLGSSAASVTFSSLPQTFDDLVLLVSTRTSVSDVRGTIAMRFNGSSATNYSVRYLAGDGSTASSTSGSSLSWVSGGNSCGASATANTFSNVEIYIPNYAGSTNKSISVSSVTENNATSANVRCAAGLWAQTSAITAIELYDYDAEGAGFTANSSFQIFGIKHS